jgi:hypothetical protein
MAKRLIYKGSLNGTSPIYKYYKVNDSQDLYPGDILVFSSAKLSAAADAAAAGTVAGVCNTRITTTTATDADVAAVDVNPASIYEMVYAGSATPAINSKYDLATAPYTLDADDTTGGFIQVVGYPDTTNKNVDVMLTNRAFGVA